MQKITVPVFDSLDNPALAKILQAGGVGALLTDTVYGLVGSAKNVSVAKKIFKIKGRDHKPGTLIAADIEQLLRLNIRPEYLKAAENFWPGPVTVILPMEPETEYLGLFSLATRIPDNQALLKLLKQVGPLMTTSANRPGQPISKSVQEAQVLFGNKLDFYVDGGYVAEPVASTIIRIKIEVIRQGAVPIQPES